MFKVIVAGGRNFADYEKLKSTLNYLFSLKSEVEIVSGMARGVDSLAVKYADENDLRIKKFPADWESFGRGAGFRRNAEMAKYADACVCFWDGKSKGTAHMIQTARKHKLRVKIINYRGFP